MLSHPPFGEANLSNCDRELIHLAGSIQPHGVLLVVREPQFSIAQVSANAESILGKSAQALQGEPLELLGGDLGSRVRQLAAAQPLSELTPLRCRVSDSGRTLHMEGAIHRVTPGVLVVEMESLDQKGAPAATVNVDSERLLRQVTHAVQRFSAAATVGVLADTVVSCLRDMTGYDRVMVYQFDADDHGKIIAEARDPRLESLLGYHYPATDIPQRARELYLRNRVRVLVDVHYTPAALVPRVMPDTGDELDMSLSYLRSMSPLHLQYLKNMGVTATLVVSLVREGRLWGLIACHHYSPRNLRFGVRASCELLAEVISTRIGAIENYALAQVAMLVRRLEQRLLEATSTDGDWQLALFRSPRTLLQPLDASGAALFYEDEILTSGEVPSTPALRELLRWVDGQPSAAPFSCSSVGRAHPALESITPSASGVLAVKLSAVRPDYLMWFRKEQLSTVTWAGDPTKPVIGNDPLELSPRRSFAAWSEIVRGTSVPWSNADISLARAIGESLIDIVLQIHAVRLLIAEHQLLQIRSTVENSREPVVIATADSRLLYANTAFLRLIKRPGVDCTDLAELAALFTQPERARGVFGELQAERQTWRGELALAVDGTGMPVSLRAEVVARRDGSLLGFVLILTDLSHIKRAAQAREHFEHSLLTAGSDAFAHDAGADSNAKPDALIGAILANASLAAMDIADAGGGSPIAPLLEELEASTQRAAALYRQVRTFPIGD